MDRHYPPPPPPPSSSSSTTLSSSMSTMRLLSSSSASTSSSMVPEETLAAGLFFTGHSHSHSQSQSQSYSHFHSHNHSYSDGYYSIDAAAESMELGSFRSFTQCLQEGMKMDAADYSDLSRSVLVAASSSPPSPSRSSSSFSAFWGNGGIIPSLFGDPAELQWPTLASSAALPLPPKALLGQARRGVEERERERERERLEYAYTPNSSVSSSSTDEQDENPNHTLSTSRNPHLDKSIIDTNIQQTAPESKKKLSKSKKKGQKRIREPRVALVTKTDVEHLEDGYRWRKYGQKAVKNSPYPRSYYKCTYNKCTVKKRVERSLADPTLVVTTYEGQHTHHSPSVPTRASAVAPTDFGIYMPMPMPNFGFGGGVTSFLTSSSSSPSNLNNNTNTTIYNNTANTTTTTTTTTTNNNNDSNNNNNDSNNNTQHQLLDDGDGLLQDMLPATIRKGPPS